MIFTPGQTVGGFTIERVEDLPDIESVAYIGRHEVSGARLLYLANDDVEKSFSIGFKTIPHDSTGVFHILEHSVLCGSERFPVKEPFVNLLKCSMQTFLNAMTFPDKTLYPVASTNEKDLRNLVDVYMDAVFHPAIFTDPMIFKQEGWHYEIEDGAPVLNGVVLNEMKGALSDPQSLLFNGVMGALFPDNCYCFESGGDPDVIPDLTYEAFLEEHLRHYRPDNSYIMLYGDLDAAAMLEFLDEQYLSPWVAEHSMPLVNNAGETLLPRPLPLQEPVCNLDAVVEAVTSPENEMCALGYVQPWGHDPLKIIATDVMLSALAGTNESPLRRALLDADLADKITINATEEILQPAVTVEMRQLHEGAYERALDVFRTEVQKLIDEGFDKELILASIAREEFTLREREFGGANGVIFAMNALNTWLYDDDAATAALKFGEHFAALRELLDTRFFEDLATQLFLANNHMTRVHLIPVPQPETTKEEARLSALAEAWGPEDFRRGEAELAELRDRQERPDAPEDVAKLPQLTLEDLAAASPLPPFHAEQQGPDTILVHDVATAGIGYLNLILPVEGITAEELPYLRMLALLLGRMDTAEHTALQLDTLDMLHLGSCSFQAGLRISDDDPDFAQPVLRVSASALEPEVPFAAKYLAEILCTTDFSDLERIKIRLQQMKMSFQDLCINDGRSLAKMRCEAARTRAAAAADYLKGLYSYKVISDGLDNWEEFSADLPSKLARVARLAMNAPAITIGIAGGADIQQAFLAAWNDARENYGAVPGFADADATAVFAAPEPVSGAEAFTVPSNVTFTVLSGDPSDAFGATVEEQRALASDGTWNVARTMLNYDYLWNNVRVKGGAYGCGFTKGYYGNFQFSSFRDPRIDETLARYAEAAQWLATVEPEEDEFLGYIISTVSGFDKPVRAKGTIALQLEQFLMNRDPAERLMHRAQALAATVEDMHRLGRALSAIIPSMTYCTVGSADIIKSAQTPFTVEVLIPTSEE